MTTEELNKALELGNYWRTRRQISPQIVNEALCGKAAPADLIRLGFVERNDGTGDPRGTWWTIKNDKFEISLDCVFVVHLTRLNPDSDQITVCVEDLFDLQMLVDWIADE